MKRASETPAIDLVGVQVATWATLDTVAYHGKQDDIAFITRESGWIGSLKGGYRTLDGGANWRFVEMGRAVNKIRLMPVGKGSAGFVGFAIGVEVRKIEVSG